MAIRNADWYNTNEVRDYPLLDSATCLTDAGVRLPQDIISDLRLRWPRAAGQYAFISAVTITDGAITVVIQVASTANNVTNECVAIAAITVPKEELEVRRQYPVEALYPGTFGYITFGSGSAVNFTGRFTTPLQTELSPRAARAYDDLPIPSMRKLYQNTGLTGLVLLRGEAPIEIVAEDREIAGRTETVIVIRLVDSYAATVEGSVFQEMAGPCSKRPESHTCGTPEPIEYINAVGPDCDGVLEIEFKGCAIVGRNIDDCSVVLDCGLGLSESCSPPYLPDDEGRLPTEYEAIIPTPPLPPEPPVVPPDSISDQMIVLGELPYEETFEDGMAQYFSVKSGQFMFITDDFGVSYATEGPASAGARNVVVWKGFDVTTLYRQVITELRLMEGPTGARHNAGVAINYRPSLSSPSRYVYYIAEIDYDQQEFRIQRFNGVVFRPAVAASVPGITLGHRYRITVQVQPRNASSVEITARLDGITEPSLHVTIGPLLTNNYLPDTGYFGLGTNRAMARFMNFRLEEWTS